MKNLFTLFLFCLLILFLGITGEANIKQFRHRAKDKPHRSRIYQHINKTINQSPGNEFLIDRSSGFFKAPEDQELPAVAFDGVNYLVVWTDERNGNLDIYGARVTKEGILLDSSGIAISKAVDDQGDPKVAFDGTNFFVVWDDLRNGYPDRNIYGARVSRDGILLDTNGIAICTLPNEQRSPSLAFDGTNYFIVWYQVDQWKFHIYGARVNKLGMVIDTAAIQLITTESSQPSISYDGTNYFLVWTDYRHGHDIYGARLSTSGEIIDTAYIPICTKWPTEESNPEIAFNGTDFLVVWEEEWPNYDIYGARVSPTGIVLDTNGIVLSNAISTQAAPSVTSDGNNFFVVWWDNRGGNDDIYGARVSANGELLDSTGIPLLLNSNSLIDIGNPSIINGDSTYYLVWSEHIYSPDNKSGDDIYGSRINRNGSILDSNICISTVNFVVESWEPAVAFDDTNYFVVWESYLDDTTSDIRGARVNQSGLLLDTLGIDIFTDDDDQFSPSIAFGKNNYLVVCEDWNWRKQNSDINGAIVNRDGSITERFQICYDNGDQVLPRIAFGDTIFFVVWEDWRYWGTTGPDIYGARVTQDGSVLDWDFSIYEKSGWDQEPDVDFDGTNFLVVWEHWGHDDDIYGCRVSMTGEVLDEDGFIISNAKKDQENPAIAFDGNNYLIVWEDNRNNDTSDIYAARVTPMGVVLDSTGIPICTAQGYQECPSVVFDGTNFIITWDDYRNDANIPDIYGARVNSNGVIIEEIPVIAKNWESSPTLARGTGNDVILVYTGWTDDYNGTSYNTYRVWGKLNPLTSGISEPSTGLPIQFKLQQNYPNPFNPSTTIKFEIPKASFVTLKIYNLLGQEVAELVNEEKQPGVYEVNWNASGFASGVYFYKLTATDPTNRSNQFLVSVKKLINIK